MKIIFSRKGFDSGVKSGGVASPILPGGTLCPLPIPEATGNDQARPYAGIQTAGQPAGDLVEQLTGKRIRRTALAHLDPDLDPGSVPRAAGWKPLFGQAGAAESHLQNQGVGAGDLFLFFGWFREVEEAAGRYRYRRNSPDRHVIFGWLQVEKRLSITDRGALPAWALRHPHAKRVPYAKRDSLYLAAGELHLNGQALGLPGGGLFRQFDEKLRLSAEGALRSVWALPGWLHPEGRETCLSYHGNPARWSRQGNATLLKTVPRGQEFVLDCEDYPEAVGWAQELLAVANGAG